MNIKKQILAAFFACVFVPLSSEFHAYQNPMNKLWQSVFESSSKFNTPQEISQQLEKTKSRTTQDWSELEKYPRIQRALSDFVDSFTKYHKSKSSEDKESMTSLFRKYQDELAQHKDAPTLIQEQTHKHLSITTALLKRHIIQTKEAKRAGG